jgi:hypothetical protein
MTTWPGAGPGPGLPMTAIQSRRALTSPWVTVARFGRPFFESVGALQLAALGLLLLASFFMVC